MLLAGLGAPALHALKRCDGAAMAVRGRTDGSAAPAVRGRRLLSGDARARHVEFFPRRMGVTLIWNAVCTHTRSKGRGARGKMRVGHTQAGHRTELAFPSCHVFVSHVIA